MSFYEPIKMKVSYGCPPARTGKDYGLPEEYAEWVEVPFHLVNIGDNYVTTHFIHYPNGPLEKGFSIVGIAKFFVPPKPKPTLPDVGPGAVLGYTSKLGSKRRAIRGVGKWRVFEQGTPVVFFGSNFTDPIALDSELLADVDDDGFTVELGGLE